jgi:hypothetical protein
MRLRVLGCGVLALSAIVLAPAAPAQAIPMCRDGYQCQTYFYSGPDHDEEVGYWSTDCSGEFYREGRMTQWSYTDQVRCNPL